MIYYMNKCKAASALVICLEYFEEVYGLKIVCLEIIFGVV